MSQESLLLFVGHHSILAWGCDGQAWESEKLSDEGLTIDGIDGGDLARRRLGDEDRLRKTVRARLEERSAASRAHKLAFTFDNQSAADILLGTSSEYAA